MRLTDLLQQGKGEDLLEEFARASSSREPLNDFQELIDLAAPADLGAVASQVDARDFTDHVTPGVGGTDPLGALQPSDRASIAEKILGSLSASGVGLPDVLNSVGLGGGAPQEWGADDLARLLGYTQQNHPDAFGQVVGQLRDQPNVLQRLLGNRAIQAMLLGLVTRMMTRRPEKPNV